MSKFTAKDLINKVEQEKLNDEMLKIVIDSLYDLAKGVYVLEETQFGTVRRYKKEPNKEAGIYLCDRLLGKVPQAIKGTGDQGEHIIKVIQFAGDK